MWNDLLNFCGAPRSSVRGPIVAVTGIALTISGEERLYRACHARAAYVGYGRCCAPLVMRRSRDSLRNRWPDAQA